MHMPEVRPKPWNYLVLMGGEILLAPATLQTPKNYIFVFLSAFMHYESNSGPRREKILSTFLNFVEIS